MLTCNYIFDNKSIKVTSNLLQFQLILMCHFFLYYRLLCLPNYTTVHLVIFLELFFCYTLCCLKPYHYLPHRGNRSSHLQAVALRTCIHTCTCIHNEHKQKSSKVIFRATKIDQTKLIKKKCAKQDRSYNLVAFNISKKQRKTLT